MTPRRTMVFSRRANIGVAALCGVAGLFLAVCAVIVLAVGPYYLLAMQLVAALFVCVANAFFVSKLQPYVAPRAGWDDTGTTFRPDRGLDIPKQLIRFGMIVTWVSVSYTFVGVIWQWPWQGSSPLTNGWPAVILALFAVALGAVLVGRYLRWGASRHLRVTPGGIELGHWRRRSCDWAQIREVPGVVDVTGAVSLWRALRPNDVVVISDAATLRLPAGAFLFTGKALRYLVEFYWRHPEARGELTDGSAPRRLTATSNPGPRLRMPTHLPDGPAPGRYVR